VGREEGTVRHAQALALGLEKKKSQQQATEGTADRGVRTPIV